MSGACVVRVTGAADGSSTPHDNRFVIAWNPHTEAGTLAVNSTDDPLHARWFASVTVVFEEWNTVSNVQRIRPWDGEINRPLRGINIAVERAPGSF